MLAIFTEWGLGLGALGCIAGAIASFIYVPVVGRYAAAALVAIAAGLASYHAGYVARGRLDISQALEAQLKWAQEELDATKAVQEGAAARARESEQQAAKLQEKIDAYASALAAKPEPIAAPGCPKVQPCALDAGDIRVLDGLRDDARSGRANHPPGRAR